MNLSPGKDYDFKFTNTNWYTPIEFCIVFRGDEGATASVNLEIDVIDDSHPLISTNENLSENENQMVNLEDLMDQVIKQMNNLNEKERLMRDLNGNLWILL